MNAQHKRLRRGRSPSLITTCARAGVFPLGLVVCVTALGCAPPPLSSAEVRASFGEFSQAQLLEFGAVRADLEILLDDGSPATAEVQLLQPDGPPTVAVTSPVPMRCAGLTCELSFGLPAGSYRFTLNLYAADRCGRESLIGAFRPLTEGALRLNPWQPFLLDLSRARFDFDDDGDQIINALEIQTCGRSDWDDRDQTPEACVGNNNPCCQRAQADLDNAPAAWGSELIGRGTRFDGGQIESAEGLVTVEPFVLDATEVTFGQLARCVAAGQCLGDDVTHPVRTKLNQSARHLPATGLSPNEAAAYCGWAGKRLPTDNEWHFAAAARPPQTAAAPFPFDADNLAHLFPGAGSSVPPAPLPTGPGDLDVGCVESIGVIAVNHTPNLPATCALAPVAVASFPSSYAYRGQGPPVADLAGNVWEWTRTGERTFIRGGNFRSGTLVLSNDLNRLEVDDGDILQLTRDGERAADRVGFRCAAGETGPQPTLPVTTREPPCGN